MSLSVKSISCRILNTKAYGPTKNMMPRRVLNLFHVKTCRTSNTEAYRPTKDWMSRRVLNLFHVKTCRTSNCLWKCVQDPLHVRPIAHAIWDPYFGQLPVEVCIFGRKLVLRSFSESPLDVTND
ncbi:unnamed protein product [Arabidopsis lyrata]|uniref:Predicted protein n=1 Tax=Arabidopsis lyrata subsp. lyrata TaxID=81972 RepID=D7LZT2_ARALL|nr:predicted protein [Arabidopsis lyrata subsp. lyrata]CAH8270284.1 unnamed protein product [Arabidopsis lyrata]